MRIDEFMSNAKYRKDEQFQNLIIFWESSRFNNFGNFLMMICNKLLNLWQFQKLSNLHNWILFYKIHKIYKLKNVLSLKNFKNSKNIKFEKLSNNLSIKIEKKKQADLSV